MRAQITQVGGYRCAPKGHTVEHFERLEVVTGKAAAWAVAAGAAKVIPDTPPIEASVPAPLETQAEEVAPEVKRGRGRPRKVRT